MNKEDKNILLVNIALFSLIEDEKEVSVESKDFDNFIFLQKFF